MAPKLAITPHRSPPLEEKFMVIFATSTFGLQLATSKGHLKCCVEDWSRAAEREGNRCVADRGPVRIEKLVVPADNSVFEGKVVDACAEVPWTPVIPNHFRSSGIGLERFLYYHR